MISRLYIVKMPQESPGTPLDILVQANPGSKDAPVDTGDGAYYELRGRPLRLETLVGDTGFVPRLRLGFTVSITSLGTAPTRRPGVQLSESLVGDLSSTDAGPALNVPVLPDPGGEPVIRLNGANSTAGNYYLVALQCAQAADDDRSGSGA